MSDPIDPTRGVEPEKRVKERRSDERRAKDRRSRDRRSEAGQAKTALPVPVSSAKGSDPPTPTADAVFAAQLIGQTGQKRGLKGGPPVLEEARSTYLETEWSGPSDRRLRAGRITKTQA